MTNAEMTCRDGVQHLADYTDGVLDPEVSRTLEAHVAGCARCTAFVRSYTAVPAILRRATSVTLSAEGQQALRRALAGRRG